MGIDIEALSSALVHASWGNNRESMAKLAAIIQSGDSREKRRLFKRFFLEGVPGSAIKALFDKEDIKSYLRSMNRHLPRSIQEKRRKVWRHLYLGENETIPELDWVLPRR